MEVLFPGLKAWTPGVLLISEVPVVKATLNQVLYKSQSYLLSERDKKVSFSFFPYGHFGRQVLWGKNFKCDYLNQVKNLTERVNVGKRPSFWVLRFSLLAMTSKGTGLCIFAQRGRKHLDKWISTKLDPENENQKLWTWGGCDYNYQKQRGAFSLSSLIKTQVSPYCVLYSASTGARHDAACLMTECSFTLNYPLMQVQVERSTRQVYCHQDYFLSFLCSQHSAQGSGD